MNAFFESRGLYCVLLLGAAIAPGCGDNKGLQANTDDAGAVATGPQKPVLGGKLGAAVAAAESAPPTPSASATEGPPENGVFAPGMADKAFAKDAPVKVELLGDGAAPRFYLKLTEELSEQRENVTVTMHLGGSGGVLIDYLLVLKREEAKGEGAAKSGGAGAPALLRVVATVASANAGASAPRDVAEQYAKLKGSQVKYALTPLSAISNVTYSLPKDVDPSMEGAVRGLADSITVLTTPLPSKAVGVGGYWMATDRGPSYLGVEVLRYRVFRVEKVEKDKATLSADVRQYSTRDEADLGSLAAGQRLGIDRFESSGKQHIEWTPFAFLPQQGETSLRINMLARVPGSGPGNAAQRAVVQTELQAKMTAPPGKVDKKK
jgi:hypothetical protein